VAGHEVAAEPVVEPERPLQIDGITDRQPAERGPSQGFRAELEFEPAGGQPHDRQAAATHADAVTQSGVCGQRPGLDRQSQARRLWHRGHDRS